MSYRGASLAEHRLALGSIGGTWSRARCNTRDSAFLGTGQILFPHILEPFHSLKFVSAVCIPPELWSRLYQVPSQRLAPFHVPMLPRLVPRGGRSFHGLWQGHTARSHCSLYLYLRYSLREAYFVLVLCLPQILHRVLHFVLVLCLPEILHDVNVPDFVFVVCLLQILHDAK